ncbi:MAG TPA: class I SAM-dependent methyltransferase [Bryobacteraceae bacterium]|nr:class I SAM-dependent methyltransferase [Bryobacteraceae bacterium]
MEQNTKRAAVAKLRQGAGEGSQNLFASNAVFCHWRTWGLLETELKRRGFCAGTSDWLDVGCGDGELLCLGSSFFRRAIGCDSSVNPICGETEVVLQTQPSKLPFPDSSFDLVTAVCIYRQLPIDMRQVLSAEIFRVLRPGGTACFIEHNPLNPITRRILSRTRVGAAAAPASHWDMTTLVWSAGLRKPVFRFFLYLPERMYTYIPALESLLANIPLGGQYALFCERPDRVKSVRSGVRKAFGAGMPLPVPA